jgi:hypothetical protein
LSRVLSRQRGPASGEGPVRASPNAAGRVAKQRPASHSTKTQPGAGYLEGQGPLNSDSGLILMQRIEPVRAQPTGAILRSTSIAPTAGHCCCCCYCSWLLAAGCSAERWATNPTHLASIQHSARLLPPLGRPCCDAADTDRGSLNGFFRARVHRGPSPILGLERGCGDNGTLRASRRQSSPLPNEVYA